MIATTVSQEINGVMNTLVKQFRPKQVILFGSHAYGLPAADSDIDICVILDLAGRRKLDWIRDMRRALAGMVSKPLDILVFSEEEFDAKAALSSTLEHKIQEQGKKLYEQPRHRQGMVQGG
jgi:predicted nucleotidyltransferase